MTPTTLGLSPRIKFLAATTAGLIMFFIKWPFLDQTAFQFAIAYVTAITKPIITTVLALFLVTNALLTILGTMIKHEVILSHPLLKKAFCCSKLKLTINVLASIVVLCFFSTAFEAMNTLSKDVIAMSDTVFIFLTVSKILLPLISDYGLAEFLEVYLNRWMRPIFRLPGTTVMPIITSAFVSVTVAIMLISEQFYKGYYTRRETLFLITCLTLPAMPITILLSDLDGLTALWGLFYLALFLTAIILSIIMIRIPPLSNKEDTYYVASDVVDDAHLHASRFQYALSKAGARAIAPHDGPLTHLRNVLINMTSFIPSIIVYGTVGMFLIEKTPVIYWITKPYALYLGLFHLNYPEIMAPALFLNTVDVILPPVLLKSIPDVFQKMTMQVILIIQMAYLAPILLTLSIETLARPIEIVKIALLRIVLIVPIAVAILTLLY